MKIHFERLTNAFSKKFENHVYLAAIWARSEELVAAMDEIAPKPGWPKPCKKRGEEISK